MASTKKLNTKIFIERANKIHNNYYTYEKATYKNGKTNIIVTCPKHGETLTIGEKRFKVDGIDYTTKTIYEYFGSFWHGHPSRKDLKGLHPFLKVPYSELYKKTLDRIKHMKFHGYEVVYKWGR